MLTDDSRKPKEELDKKNDKSHQKNSKLGKQDQFDVKYNMHDLHRSIRNPVAHRPHKKP